jgi:hypothetical protein
MKKLNISQVDTIFASDSYPIEFLLYYRNGVSTKKIRSALKTLSAAFWPMFGEHDAGIIHFDRYDEHACFDEMIVDRTFDMNAGNETIYNTYRSAVPTDINRLFFLKVVQLKNGTVIIPKLNHLAGDGYSYFFFLAALAMSSRNPLVKFLSQFMVGLNHKRTVLKPFHFTETALEPTPDPKNMIIEFETISKSSIRARIKEITARTNQAVSTNDILSAMVLKRTVENQRQKFSGSVRLTIPMDIRRNIKEYGPKFFGNGLMFNDIMFNSNRICDADVNDIAADIRKEVPDVTNESYLNYLAEIEQRIADRRLTELRPYDSEQGCLVTNLSRLPATQLDFGSGVPDYIFPLTVGKNSAAVLADRENFMLRLVF